MTVSSYRRPAAAAAAAAIASAAAAVPALGAEGPDGVRPGNNITVFHNIDMVIASGGVAGGQTQVDVFRGPYRVATTRGAAVDAGEGPALEVNHGPEGAPQPGDCFEGATPNVQPGDRIRVSNPGGPAGVDDVIVDDIRITAPTVQRVNPATGNTVVAGTIQVHVDDDNNAATPSENDDADALTTDTPVTQNVERDSVTNAIVTNARQEVWVDGTAHYVSDTGVLTPMPIGDLDSAEFLGPDDNQLRMGPNVVDPRAGVAGGFRMRYWTPFVIDRNRNNRDTAYIFNALSDGGGHGVGYGHVDPLPPVSMLVEGVDEQAGPAPGCESAPKLADSAGTVSTARLNVASMSAGQAGDTVLTVAGFAAATTTSAQVALSDGTQTLNKSVEFVPGTGQRGWGAAFTRQEIEGLGQGTLTARLVVGGAPVGAAKTVAHDTVAPSFGVSLAPGTYTGAQRLAITGATDAVTYSLDGGPSQPYTGIAIDLGHGAHTVAVRSEDAAGNVTQQTFAYQIDAPAPPAPAGGSGSASGSGSGGQAGVAGLPNLGGAPASVTPGTVALALRAARRGSGRVSLSDARQRGLAVRFTAPAGTTTARVRVLRLNGRLLGSTTARIGAGEVTVRVRSRSLRRKIRAGRYRVLVTLSGAGASARTTSWVLRVTR
jgi:hypothetical protein